MELLTQGAEINVIASNGNTPLHCAASKNRKNVVELLLRSGADPSIPNEAGYLAAELATTAEVKALLIADRRVIVPGVTLPHSVHREVRPGSGSGHHVNNASCDAKARLEVSRVLPSIDMARRKLEAYANFVAATQRHNTVDPFSAQTSAVGEVHLNRGDEITVTEEALAAFNAAFKKAEYQLHSPREAPRRRLSACSHVTFNAAITGPDGCAVDVRSLLQLFISCISC